MIAPSGPRPIEWEEPPKGRSGSYRGRVALFVEALKARPGVWAVYARGARTRLAATNKRRYHGTDWSCRAERVDGPRTYTIYARWVGP